MHVHNYEIKETFISSENQKLFRMDKPFVNGTINVYVNGSLQSFGENGDYVTFGDSGSILFSRPIYSGSIVSAVTNRNVDFIKVMSFGRRDTPNALYQKYGSTEKLRHNNRYHVKAVIGGKLVEWSFTSVLTPMWCTVQRIHEDIGEFIQGFTDEYIANMIHRNSWELIDMINEAQEGENADSLNEKALPIIEQNPLTGMYESSFKSANNWVRYKTEIDLVYARYFGISFRYGSREKSIGDISVRNEVKLPYIDQLLDRLRKALDDMEDEIFGAGLFANSFQKGRVNYDYETVARNVSW